MQNQVGDEVYCFDFFETEDRMIKKKKGTQENSGYSGSLRTPGLVVLELENDLIRIKALQPS